MATAAKQPEQHGGNGPRWPITMDRLKKKKPIEVTVFIPGSDADVEALTDARNERDLARLRADDDSPEDQLKLHAAEVKLKTIEDGIRDDGLEFVFRGIGRLKYENLIRACPPTDAQIAEHGVEGIAYDPEAFLPKLLAATVVNSDLTAEQWDKDVLDSDDWGQGECSILINNAMLVNRQTRVATLGN